MTSMRPSQHGTLVTASLDWPASTASDEFHIDTESATVQHVSRHIVREPPHTHGSASEHSLSPAQHGRSRGQLCARRVFGGAKEWQDTVAL